MSNNDTHIAEVSNPGESRDYASPINHKFRTTEYLESIMDPTDPNDPIARQYIPSDEEKILTDTDHIDPIGDKKNSKTNLIIHRYPDRLLLMATDYCSAYCRFCFRKDRVGKGNGAPNDEDLDRAIEYIENNTSIWEVIFSGGDPLVLSPRRLKLLNERLSKIEHVKVIRYHTRLPVADPARIDEELCDAIKSSKTTYICIHANHPDEFTVDAKRAFKLLQQTGAILLSQSVLLKTINDNADVLEKLLRSFVECGIKPYYLHHPDMVQGTKHFQLSINDGQEILKQLRGKVSGLCWPTYVLDIPGGFGKVPINETYLTKTPDGKYLVEDIYGNQHPYPPNS